MSLSNLQDVMDNDSMSSSYSVLTPSTIASTSPHQRCYYSSFSPDGCSLSVPPYRSNILSSLSNPVFSPSPNRQSGSQSLPYSSKLATTLDSKLATTLDSKLTRSQRSLQSIHGHVFELATDYAGCRMLQQIVDSAPPPVLYSLLDEVLLQLEQLMTHPYGSFFFQRLLERGDDALRDSIVVVRVRIEV